MECSFHNEYYCSEECLGTEYEWDEYIKMYENDEAYWTSFDGCEDEVVEEGEYEYE